MSPFLQAENRATEAERTVSKLQKEVDRLEGRPGMNNGVTSLAHLLASLQTIAVSRFHCWLQFKKPNYLLLMWFWYHNLYFPMPQLNVLKIQISNQWLVSIQIWVHRQLEWVPILTQFCFQPVPEGGVCIVECYQN